MDIRKSIISAVALAVLMSAPTVAMASPHHEGGRGEGSRAGHHDHGYRDGRHEGYGRREYRYGGGGEYYYYRGRHRYHHYWDPFRLIWVDVIAVDGGGCP